MLIHRRELLVSGAGGAALLAASAVASAAPEAQSRSRAAAGPGKHAPVALPFKPSSLTGISEKMITSHHDKNYAGAVKNLNSVETDLAALKPNAPGYLVAGLRERELLFANSITLHENYFANLGGGGKRSGALDTRLGTDHGAATWEAAFRANALALSGGSGWVVLALNLHDGALRISSAINHTQALAMGAPLLVIDMYEHAYAIDYGPDASSYVEAFFKNASWEVVEQRYDRALKAFAALG
jgi:Fe-Mn family superoxide dismutase